MPVRLGYACLNMTLQSQKPKVTCNRGMIKRTFQAKGITYASELALQNTADLVKIIRWNIANNVEVFRITSCLFPWGSEYQLEDLPDFEQISKNLALAGSIARSANQRLSFHPGPFNILSSPKEQVVNYSSVDDSETASKCSETPSKNVIIITIHFKLAEYTATALTAALSIHISTTPTDF